MCIRDSFIKEYLVEGEIPVFSDSVSSNQVLISKALATKMKLKLGDKIYTYYIQDDILSLIHISSGSCRVECRVGSRRWSKG